MGLGAMAQRVGRRVSREATEVVTKLLAVKGHALPSEKSQIARRRNVRLHEIRRLMVLRKLRAEGIKSLEIRWSHAERL